MHQFYERFILLIILLFCIACGPNSPREFSTADLKPYLHATYFSPLKMTAQIDIQHQDQNGSHEYTGHLFIDRAGISRLEIPHSQFFMFFSTDSMQILSGEHQKLQFDLANPNHSLLPFREVAVIEPNPLRYLSHFHHFFLQPTTPDSVVILARSAEPNPVLNAKIFIARANQMVTDVYFYAPNGDLCRHVTYGKFTEQSGYRLPTEIAIDFAAGARVDQEIYRLKEIEFPPANL